MSHVPEESASGASESGSFAKTLRAVAPDERRKTLEDFVRADLCSRLQLDPPQLGSHDGLVDHGVNSLKAIELRAFLQTELDLSLRSSLLFDYPTVDTLVTFLLQTFEEKHGADLSVRSPAVTDASKAKPRDEGVPPPAASSEDDLADLLAAEMGRLNAILSD